MTPLVIPTAALRDERSIQMLNAWIAERGFHCTLNIGFFDGQGYNEKEALGVFLADLVRHIGNAWATEHGTPVVETIEAVMASLNSELDIPTSNVVGEIHVGHS